MLGFFLFPILGTNELPHEQTRLVSIQVSSEHAEQVELSYGDAAKKVIRFSGPYVVSRLSLSTNYLINGLMFKKFGQNAADAGSLVTSLIYCAMGTARAFLSSTGLVIKANPDDDPSHTLKQSLMIVIPASIISGAPLYFAKEIADLLGNPLEVANEAGEYFKGFCWGIPGILGTESIIQYGMALGKEDIAHIAHLYPLLSMAIGYPLGLYTEYWKGMFGFGCGSTIAGWVTFLVAMLYCCKNQKLSQFDLLSKNLGTHRFKDLLKIGSPAAVSRFVEWVNFVGISLMMGDISKDALAATEVSVQTVAPYNYAMLGFAQAAGLLIKNHQSNPKHARKIGDTSIFLGVFFASCMMTLMLTATQQLNDFFTKSNSTRFNNSLDFVDSGSNSEIDLVKWIFLANGIGLLFDAGNNIVTSILRSYKDLWYVPCMYFLFATCAGLSAGGVMTLKYDKNPAWQFWTRTIGIALTTILTTPRYFRTINQNI